MTPMPTRVLILGAAGRDFHNFNVLYRDNPDFEVVGFTATQIPNIDGRRYPPELAGDGYPDGISIHPEAELENLVRDLNVDLVLFSYSDVTHEHVMHLAARAVAAGAAYGVAGGETMLPSSKPVIAVTATRTGAGKSPASRKIHHLLTEAGKRVVAVRHPMPYGDLVRQRVQRFATFADLTEAEVTIEEREEYERYVATGTIIYAGVDYGAILESAEAEADIILWDGGNNDLPFYKPDLHLCVADAHRAGHGLSYWPGEANLRRADVVLINKVDTATAEQLEAVEAAVAGTNPDAIVIRAAGPIRVDEPELVTGKRVLVLDDGPTITHGGMPYGAGLIAAQDLGASEIIDPRPFAVGTIAGVYEAYPHIGAVLPAMGYGEAQQIELRETIDRAAPDTVVVGTPIDLAALLELEIPHTRVHYTVEEQGSPTLAEVLADYL
ncbi:MAG: GTPase [Acidimicrobiia bacterium]|nr:GTPase [Acidimicrobiia bacterium]NNL12323.1 GTPase [Acidimicrobiia bacterium]RZV41438.1 MAG: GTPase [Acidimicrobiia bacterium]